MPEPDYMFYVGKCLNLAIKSYPSLSLSRKSIISSHPLPEDRSPSTYYSLARDSALPRPVPTCTPSTLAYTSHSLP
jgi:hypothetical protein